MNRATATAAVAALAIVVVAVVITVRGRDAVEPTTSITPRLAVAAGTWVEHTVAIEETTSTVPFAAGGAAPMKGATSVVLTLRLEAPRGLAPLPTGAMRLRARVVDVERATLTVDGRSALPEDTAAKLLATTAELDLLPSGQVTSLRVPQSDDPTVRRLLGWMIGELTVSIADGSSWTAEERLPRATFNSHWRLDDNTDVAATLVRRERQLQKANAGTVDLGHSTVQGEARVVLLRRGVIKSFVADETSILRDKDGALVEQRSIHVTQTLVGEGILDDDANTDEIDSLDDDAVIAATAVEEAILSDAAGKDALRRRADGLTRELLHETLKGAVVSGAVGDPQRFMWRASAAIRLDDTIVDDIEALFLSDEARTPGRALLADLLVGAGTERAQTALVTVLDSPVVAAAPEHVALRQRLALLQAPTPATIAFLDAHASDDDGDWRDPARVALGSAVRHRSGHNDADGASAAFAALERESNDVADTSELQTLLIAHGNTYDARSLPFLSAHAADATAQIRHVVAGALRGIDDDGARATLATLGSDVDASVARRAWESLQAQPPRLDIVALAHRGVQARTIPEGAWNTVVTLCAKRLQDDALKPEALATLQVVVDQAGDSRLISRARGLLRRHSL